ncbi:MAG: mechanosensitive ion channel family protein [Acidobacteria bacterium]|nr:mechanosensitive ion channel family protein [Acidobacteriota bacterium]
MKPIWEHLPRYWPQLVIPLLVLFAVVAIGWFARRFLFRILERWAGRSKARFDDLLVGALRGPFMLWVLILGLHLATQSSELPVRVTALVSKALLILWIVSLTVVAAQLAGSLIKSYGGGVSSALPVTTLTQNVASLSVATMGTLILLNMLGIPVTPILTALGVGGIAVALALQDTLSNLFAGFYVSLAGQVRVGDYIKIETGEEGYVTDISWRSTTMRALPNNLIIVPNAKLAQAIVTNYHLPEKRMSLLLPVGVSYDSDPEAIERILIEEAASGAQEIPGLLAEPAPFVRFIPGFGDSSLNFTLICQVAEFVDQYPVQHELRKRIFKRFRQEGIEIPFPIRTVYIKDGLSGVTACGAPRQEVHGR